MASLTMLNPEGAMIPEENKSTYNTSSHKLTANLGSDKLPLDFSPADSPKDIHLQPNTRKANNSHQSQVHSHHKEFHATSADDQLSGCHHDSKVNSASQVKLWSQPHRSRNLSSPTVKNTHRYIPYLNPTKQHLNTLTESSELNCLSEKSSKPRKRTVIIKPKFPKYEGLSHFAAPVDLVSDMIPCTNTTNTAQSISSPSLKSVSGRDTDKISRERNTASTNTGTHPTEENSQTPVDFLKYLDFEEWDRRKQNLSRMVEERKKLFLQNGFAETSGKPFQPDEQAIGKKPIPNRWVWYMHLSTDYDKLKNTRVPPGGPAGYLKYGWDRLGPAGKQPYQELADIYSAQRLKFMAAHGITEENAKKKPKQSEKPKTQRHTPQELTMRADHHPTALMNGPLGTNVHIDVPFVPLQPIPPCNLLYQQLNPFVHEKLPSWNCPNGPADIFELNEAASHPSYRRSPEMTWDFFSPFYNEFYNEAGHGSHYSVPIQPMSTPIGFPTSPNEYAFSGSPVFPCQATSEFQSRYTLSPESVHSAHSDMSGVFSTSSIDNGLASSAFVNLAPSNPFSGVFNSREMDFHSLNPVDINS